MQSGSGLQKQSIEGTYNRKQTILHMVRTQPRRRTVWKNVHNTKVTWRKTQENQEFSEKSKSVKGLKNLTKLKEKEVVTNEFIL